MQAPEQSPDRTQLAFSSLAHVYVMPLRTNAMPRRLTTDEAPEFQPSWSPDGAGVTYVTWTADAGHLDLGGTARMHRPRAV